MKIIFYNIVSIAIGIILVIFGIKSLLKSQKKVFPVLILVHSVLFIGFGVAGFFFPDMYSYIVILAMLAFTITLILCFLLWGKKEPEDKKAPAKKKKEEKKPEPKKDNAQEDASEAEE